MLKIIEIKKSRSSIVSTKDENGSCFKLIIQPKLAINQPDDLYKQEANAMGGVIR